MKNFQQRGVIFGKVFLFPGQFILFHTSDFSLLHTSSGFLVLHFAVRADTLFIGGVPMDPVRHLRVSIIVLALLISLGIAGYMGIEGWDFLDSLYMTVITLATVGFKEVHTLSDHGKIFTMLLIVLGVSVLGYIVGSLAQIMFEGQFQRIMGRKKVEKKIEALRDHYIVCGFGRMGALICREFAAKPLPFVVVEKMHDVIEKLEADGYLFLRGDATDDETLLRAGIKQAKGLISVVASDTENVYITLTARELNPDLFILARSGAEGSDIKLKRAGASKVISPYLIGGNRMAQAILVPTWLISSKLPPGGSTWNCRWRKSSSRRNPVLSAKTWSAPASARKPG